MNNHTDHINLAARAMTAVEPPTDLEARIKRRLDTETLRTPSRWRPAYWIGAAGLTATAALLALLMVQGPTGPARRSLGEGGSTVQGSPEVPGSRGTVVRGEVTGARGPAVPQPIPDRGSRNGRRDHATAELRNPAVNRGTSGPRDLGTSSGASSAELAWMSRRVPALEMIDPLAMDRLTLDSIQPAAMLITPLTITPLVTAPVVGDPDTGRQQ